MRVRWINKKTTVFPPLLGLPGIFQYSQERFVLLVTFGTHINMFADEWHEFFRVMRLDFGFNEFVQTNEHFITGHFLSAYLLKDAQELDDDFILQFILRFEDVSNTLKNVFIIHAEKLTINPVLILLVFESHQQILGGQVFEGKAFF